MSTIDKPNIILINCDDLGYGDLQCYGSERNDTPHVDQLAAQGMRFTDFYVSSPVCSASRASLLTGCYSQRVGMAHYQVLTPGQAQGLNPEEATIARQLKQAGYDTKLVGKWHCGDQPEFLPTNHGFDEYFGLPYSNDMGRQIGGLDRPPLPLMRDDVVMEQQPDQRGLTERYVAECLEYIGRDRTNPFFLYLAHMYVHVPLFVPDRFLKQSRNGAYGGAVACIDWAMGKIDTELKRLGLFDDTLVIFMSDNGSRARGEGGSNGGLRGLKGETWEGGQRVPFIVRWPGRIKAGEECHGLATAMDIFKTLADISGAPLPDRELDSISLADTLLHGVPVGRDTFAFYKDADLEAVRVGDWKLHFCKSSRVDRQWVQVNLKDLYNLREDPAESNNLYDQHPDLVRELEEAAQYIRAQFGDGRLGVEGSAIRPVGLAANPKPLTRFNPDHPYFIAYYDLADMPVMSG
jgi:arylsulfatase A-like enzyme